jgi:phosphoserine phosphatase
MIRLVIFDVDGTIFQVYSWQYIHEKLGTLPQAKRHFDQFLENQISYEEWAQQDVALWKNQPLERIQKIISQMPYTRGAIDTLTSLKRNNVEIFLLSAGLTQVAERIQKEIGINRFLANTLVTKDGCLTGEVEVNVSFYSKDRHLQKILDEFNVTVQECAAVGDDPTLVPLFKKVALAIAFNPATKAVEEHADVIVKSNDLRHILPYVNASA